MHYYLKPKRQGFSLFELLIVVFIIALLVGMLLPAVQKVREAAARSQSMNNLKQLGLSVHNYAATMNVFPPGVDANQFSTSAYLLPYIEQNNLFQKIDFKKSVDDKDNAAMRGVIIKTFLNPTDPVTTVKEGFGPTNYLFNAGSLVSLKDNNGLFFSESKIKLPADIPDGTSNTLLTVETLKGDGGAKAVSVRQQHVLLKKDSLKELKPDAGVDDWKNDKNIVGDRCASWMDGRFLQGTFTGTRTINDEKPDVNCEGTGGLSGIRTFANVGLIGLADGSVRTVNQKMSLETWKNLASRNDGNVLNNDF